MADRYRGQLDEFVKAFQFIGVYVQLSKVTEESQGLYLYL